MTLTASAINNARPGAVLRDSHVPGLHVKVTTGGAAFYLYYRTKAGKERRPKLADVRVMSIAQARDMARDWLHVVAGGGDPMADREALSQRPTMADLKARYMADHANVRKKPKSAKEDGYKWDRHILPAIGEDTAVADVTKKQFVDLHHKLRATPYAANRVAALAHKAFRLAEDWGWRPDYSNPVRVTMYKERRRKRVPTVNEAVALLKALDEMRVDNPYFCGFVDLLCFTGARPDEILSTRWAWITDRGIELPDSKTGDGLIQLNEYARAVITTMPRIVGNPYLVPGRKKRGRLVSYRKMWAALCKRAGIKSGRANGGLVVYDLKRFFASAGIGAGLSLDQLMQLMRHTQAQTTRGYSFLMTDAAAAASKAAGEAVAKLRAG